MKNAKRLKELKQDMKTVDIRMQIYTAPASQQALRILRRILEQEYTRLSQED